MVNIPKVLGSKVSIATSSDQPLKNAVAPGMRNSQVGVKSIKNLRWRQPSLKGLRCGGRSLLSGNREVGSSTILRPMSEAFITISEANSIPPALRFILSNDSLVRARIPQFMSEILEPKNRLIRKV